MEPTPSTDAATGASAFDELPRRITGTAGRTIGIIWRCPKTGNWRVICGSGSHSFETAWEAEKEASTHPAKPPPKRAASRKGPESVPLTEQASGFLIRDERGREVGGAIGRPGGRFDAFALGESLGRFDNAGTADAAIRLRATRINAERRATPAKGRALKNL
jgi:hypothetical protein